MQDIALSFAFTGSTASNLKFNAALLNFTLTHLTVRWSSYHVTYMHVREHPRRLQLRSQCTRTPKRKMHESRLRKWRRGATLCMYSGLIRDCWSGGADTLLRSRSSSSPAPGLWLIPPACYRCWTRQVTRTEHQQANTRLRQAPAEPSGNIPLFSFCHSPFFDVTETNSDPPLRCLLLPGQFVSSSSSETSHRSHSPVRGVNPGTD